MVECTLLGAVVGNEQELMAVLLHDPIVAQALGVGREVALFAVGHGIAELLFELVIEVGELYDGERSCRNDNLLAEQLLYLLAVLLLDRFKHIGQQLLLHLHDILEGGDVAKLKVKAGELGGVLICVGLLGSENGAYLEYTLKAARHGHLLIELRALRKIGEAVKILDLKNLRAALARRADELGGVYLDKITVYKEFAHGVDHDGLNLEHELIFVGAKVDPAIVNALVDARTLDARALLGRRDLLAHYRQCVGYRLCGYRLGDNLNSAHLDEIVLDGGADDRDNGILCQSRYHGAELRQLLFLDGYLDFSGDILEHDESHILAVAQVLDKALNEHGFAEIIFDVRNVSSLHYLSPPKRFDISAALRSPSLMLSAKAFAAA